MAATAEAAAVMEQEKMRTKKLSGETLETKETRQILFFLYNAVLKKGIIN